MDGLTMLGDYKHGGATLCLRLPAFLTRSMRRNARELFRLHTNPKQRSQGHATALLVKVCAEADRRGISLVLCADPGRESLYEKHGFSTIQTEPVRIMTRNPSANVQA